MSAAVAGYDDELAGGDQLVEDLLDSAPAEAGAFLEHCLIRCPFAAVIGVAGDGEEDKETGPALAGVLPDGDHVLKTHGAWFPPFFGEQVGARSARPPNGQEEGIPRKLLNTRGIGNSMPVKVTDLKSVILGLTRRIAGDRLAILTPSLVGGQTPPRSATASNGSGAGFSGTYWIKRRSAVRGRRRS